MKLMPSAQANVTHTVGNTPIVKLNKIAAHLDPHVEIYAKLEYFNPGGSIKDRIGMHIVAKAETEGKLLPGGTIIEATSGNTGMGLAIAAAVKGYKCIFVMADKQSEEKRIALRSVGAKVVICPTNVEPEDPRSYYSVAKKLAAETPNSFYANQYHNPDNPEAHYLSTGPEIWNQTQGEFDVFACSIGTGGTISGISKYLKEKNSALQIVGVDPVGSLYYDLFYTGKMTQAHSYYVEGIGEDFVPSSMNLRSMDDVVQINDRQSFSMARRLIRDEGLLCGGSSGTAIAGAVHYAETKLLNRPHPQGRPWRVLVIIPDSSSRYLSKFLNDEWLKDAGLLEESTTRHTVADLLKQSKDVLVAQANDPLGTVIDTMKKHGFSQIPVVDSGKFVGVVSEVMVLNSLVRGSATMKTKVAELADATLVATVENQTPLSTLMQHFSQGKIAIVLDKSSATPSISGLITKIDVIEFLSQHNGTHATY